MATLIALKQLLIGSIPTFILVWILYLYVTRIFLRPLQKTLHQRSEETLGLRKNAEAKIAQAEQKATEYQMALQEARAEIYRIQEKERQTAIEKRAEVIRQAQHEAEEMISRAQSEIRVDVESAKKTLAADSEQIAEAIIRALLKPAPVPAGTGSLRRSEASS